MDKTLKSIFSINSLLLLSLVPAQFTCSQTPPEAASIDTVPEPGSTWRIKRVEPAPSHSSPEPKKAELSFLDRGKQFSKHGLYKEAVDFFTKASNADPENAEIYNRRARAEWQLEKNKEALEDANWAIKLNPDYAEAFCTRAAINISMGKYQEAIADASFAQELKPNLRDSYLLQASGYRSLNQHREADQASAKLRAVQNPISAFEEWQPQIDYTQYFAYMQSQAAQHWHPPHPGIVAVPIFKIHRDGSISDLRLYSSTGDPSADQAALQAVRSVSPFQKPPAGSPPDFDVFIVLDSPPGQANNQSAYGSSANNKQTNSQPNNSRAGSFEWSGAVNQGLNQGINLLQRWLPK